MAKSRSKKARGDQQDWEVQPGTEVYGADDQKIGGVTDIQDRHLIVHKGGLFAKDYRIPFAMIGDHTDERINLTVPADEATRDQDDRAVAADSADDEASVAERASSVNDTDTLAAGSGDVTGSTEVMRVPVVEEQLEATRHQVERGEVHLESVVSEHEESLDVRVTEERVHIERVPVDRLATAADLAVDGRDLNVAIYGEEIDVQKEPHVVEEVVISKDAIQEVREVSGTVRREDVEVIDDTQTREEMTAGTTSTSRPASVPDEPSRS